MKKMIPIRIPMPPKYDEVSYVDAKVMEEVVAEVNSILIMTPHEALQGVLNGIRLQNAVGKYNYDEIEIALDVIEQSLNRLQELEIVNERLEKEIREVLKK